jgi:hypothetical protein
LPAHPVASLPSRLRKTAKASNASSSQAYSRKGRDNRGLPWRHEANSPLIADGARGSLPSVSDLGGESQRSRSTRPRNPHYSRWCSAPEMVLRKALIAGNTAPRSPVFCYQCSAGSWDSSLRRIAS